MVHGHSQLMTNHFSKAVSREASVVRYIAMLRNGYANPSFAADSARRSRRIERGTCITANFPPLKSNTLIG